MAVTEHLVVSVPANTEMYVVLEKPARAGVAEAISHPSTQAFSPSQSVQELKQLLQLQRELNESASAATSNE